MEKHSFLFVQNIFLDPANYPDTLYNTSSDCHRKKEEERAIKRRVLQELHSTKTEKEVCTGVENTTAAV